jgi:hypothetical protein
MAKVALVSAMVVEVSLLQAVPVLACPREQQETLVCCPAVRD